MTQEQKAKKYDEALNWMRELYPGLHGATKEDAEHYFPELKESEDEKIRKELIELISCMHDADSRKKRWIAYLEKQKESPKSADSIPSDCVTDAKCENLHNEEGDFVFELRQIISSHRYSDIYGEYINDEEAMASEILELCKCELEKQKKQKPITINQDEKEFLADEITAFLCNYDKEFDGEDPVPSEVAEHFYLLGKQAQEQKPSINIDQLKSLMLQYLQEAANKKDDSDIQADTDKWARKILGYDFEQKPVEDWREKRKKKCPFRIADGCKQYAGVISECTGACSWVVDYPKLKEIQDKRERKSATWRGDDGMKPAEWSEEDEEMRKTIIQVLESFVSQANCESNPSLTASYPTYYKEIDWLESLSSQSKSEQKPEAKLTGWVARDKEFDSYFGLGLILFKGKPRRACNCWIGAAVKQPLTLTLEMFPDLKWEDEPMEVEITITKK